jgi:hypothetical protein
MQIVTSGAEPLPVEKRSLFLQRIGAHLRLRGFRHPSDEDVDRAVRAALRGLRHEPAA